jgi:hypothetical protein
MALFHPPVAFRSLPETTASVTASDDLSAAEQRTYQRLTSLGFLSLQHLPEPGVHFTRVCLALFVALSGFLSTLLAVFSSRNLWRHFSGPSVHGVFPLQSLSPFKELPLSREPLLSCPFMQLIRPWIKPHLDFRAFLPLKSRTRGPVVKPNPESFLS